MKAWKKGAMIGGIWGIVSFIVGMDTLVTVCVKGACSLKFPSLLKSLLIFPHLNLAIILDTFNIHAKGLAALVLMPFVFLLDIVLGITFGIIIGVAFEKYNQRRLER